MSNDEDLNEIREVADRFCETAVEAVFRYHDLTEWDPKAVPESFIQSYILDRIGERISLNLEIPVPQLWTWIGDRSQVPSDLGREVVDFVINKTNSPIKSAQDVWAIAELKRHDSVGGDRYKISNILPLFKSCQFGVAIGIADITQPKPWLDEEALKEGPYFVRSEPKSRLVEGKKRTFVGFAYVHGNSAFCAPRGDTT
jgi:hypothetical protein